MASVQIVRIDAATSLARVAANNGVSVMNIFVPYTLLSKGGQPIVISPAIRAALYCPSTSEMLLTHAEIRNRLSPTDAARGQPLVIPVGSVPEGLELFVEPATTNGKKIIPRGCMCVVFRQVKATWLETGPTAAPSLPSADASTAHSRLAHTPTPAKRVRSAAEPSPPMDRDAPAGSDVVQRIESWQRDYKKAFAEALQTVKRRKQSASTSGEASPAATPGSSSASVSSKLVEDILKATVGGVRRYAGEQPLHFLPAKWRYPKSVNIEGTLWQVPDNRILSRVFHGSDSTAVCGTVTHFGTASRLVAAFLLDDLLGVSIAPCGGAEGDSLKPRCATADEALGDAVGSRGDDDLFSDDTLSCMEVLSQRGYRIVFMAHCPWLHHGATQATLHMLGKIARFCGNRCKRLSITVILSAVSVIHTTHSLPSSVAANATVPPLLLPSPSLWVFFIAQYNGALQVDGALSMMVGGDSGFTADLQREFASNCGIPFVPRSGLGEAVAKVQQS